MQQITALSKINLHIRLSALLTPFVQNLFEEKETLICCKSLLPICSAKPASLRVVFHRTLFADPVSTIQYLMELN